MPKNTKTNQAKDRFPFNMNDHVYVRLTARGVLVFRARYGCKPDVDKDGYSKFQLWEFAMIFGDFCSIGFDLVCKPEFLIERWV